MREGLNNYAQSHKDFKKLTTRQCSRLRSRREARVLALRIRLEREVYLTAINTLVAVLGARLSIEALSVEKESDV